MRDPTNFKAYCYGGGFSQAGGAVQVVGKTV